jgi:hypothetical protein
VSLTVFACQGGTFTVALIPHTLKETTLIDRVPGDPVNLEADILLKQIAGMLKSRLFAGPRPTPMAAPAKRAAATTTSAPRRTPARRSAR